MGNPGSITLILLLQIRRAHDPRGRAVNLENGGQLWLDQLAGAGLLLLVVGGVVVSGRTFIRPALLPETRIDGEAAGAREDIRAASGITLRIR